MKTKKCSNCHIVKSYDEFRKHKSYKDGYTNKCSDCIQRNKDVREILANGGKLNLSPTRPTVIQRNIEKKNYWNEIIVYLEEIEQEENEFFGREIAKLAIGL